MISRRALFPVVAAVALIVGCDSKPVDKVPTTAPTAIKEPHEVLPHLQYLGVRKDNKDLPVVAPTDSETAKGTARWFHSHSSDMGIALTDEEIKAFDLGELKEKGLITTVTRKELLKELDIANIKLQDPTTPKIKPKKGVDPIQELLPPAVKGLDVNTLDFPYTATKETWDKYCGQALDKHFRSMFNAGLYRLLKGVPTEMWGDIVVNSVKPSTTGNTKIQDVFLAFKGQIIMQVSVIKNDNGTYGISYIQFKHQPKKLELMLKQAKANQ